MQNLEDIALPSIALAAGLAAVLIRVTRAAMLDVLREDYIRFIRARGIPESSVIFRHALRNAAGPIVTVIGMQAGYLVGGTIVVEQVFSLPGIGNMLLNGTLARNYPIVQATVLILGVMFVLANLAADLLYDRAQPASAHGGHRLMAVAVAEAPRQRSGLRRITQLDRQLQIGLGLILLVALVALLLPLLSPYQPDEVIYQNALKGPTPAALARLRQPRPRHPHAGRRRATASRSWSPSAPSRWRSPSACRSASSPAMSAASPTAS